MNQKFSNLLQPLKEGDKLADNDTRLKTGWNSYYRNEDINQDEGLCLLTEVRDFSYNYEGRNLLASCKQAEKYRKKAANGAKENVPGPYGGPKVRSPSTNLKLYGQSNNDF